MRRRGVGTRPRFLLVEPKAGMGMRARLVDECAFVLPHRHLGKPVPLLLLGPPTRREISPLPASPMISAVSVRSDGR